MWRTLLCSAFAVTLVTGNGQSPLQEAPYAQGASNLIFSEVWQILGPFQIGTREAAWGVDPLNLYGGFPNIEYTSNASFHSSLTPNATVSWTETPQLVSTTRSISKSSLKLSFSNVDWEWHRSVSGWAGLQYQAWARCNVTLQGTLSQSFVLFTDNILEFFVDGNHFWGGDSYSYRMSPLVLKLAPGVHRFEVRLVRDVRALGGALPPIVEARIEFQPQSTILSVDAEHSIFPDIVESTLSSDLASVPFRNNAQDSILVNDIILKNHLNSTALLLKPVRIAPGQTRPIAFRLHFEKDLVPASDFCLDFVAVYSKNGRPIPRVTFQASLRRRELSEPHKITYLHPSGIVSYSILRPPLTFCNKAADNRSADRLPVILALHGAGVDADSPLVRHSLDKTSGLPAWTLFPSGVNSWSSDDWHHWGLMDIESAITSIPDWIISVNWQGCGVDTESWLVTGHSNGGQGVWYTITHRPDKVFGAVPASAYSSIQKYVPYTYWRETDPFKMAVVHAALANYRHELLLPNCDTIPVLIQHGSDDDNVPTYHSRRMMELTTHRENFSYFHEIPGKGHYWHGVMTTDALLAFYEERLAQRSRNTAKPSNFSLMVANPRGTGPKNGVHVLNLLHPGQLGWLKMEVTGNTTQIRTSNIKAFSASVHSLSAPKMLIDDTDLSRAEFPQDPAAKVGFILDNMNRWKVVREAELVSLGPSLGGLEAILDTRDNFQVLSLRTETDALALQIARNLYQYFSADAEIIKSINDLQDLTGNAITVGFGINTSEYANDAHAVRVVGCAVHIRDDFGRVRRYEAKEQGLSAIFLRPLSSKRLELVVWGIDLSDVQSISRLVPLVTGVGQPDFVIADKSIAWRGIDAVLAMGFFDGNWNISRTSFLQ